MFRLYNPAGAGSPHLDLLTFVAFCQISGHRLDDPEDEHRLGVSLMFPLTLTTSSDLFSEFTSRLDSYWIRSG